MSRFWLSWYQPGEDYRPLVFPPGQVLWWCTGYEGSDGGDAILCGLVDAESEEAAWEEVRKYWPDFKRYRFTERKPDGWQPDSGRFPVVGWMLELIRKREEKDGSQNKAQGASGQPELNEL